MPLDPIPVAIALSSFEIGGTERQMTELIRRLDRSRFRVHALCFRKTGPWLPLVEEAAHEVAEFRLRSFKSPRSLVAMTALASWLRDRRIAVVHTCDRYANIFGLPAAALARVAVRIGSRRELSPPDQSRAHAAAQRFAYRGAHRVVANSTAAAARLAEEGVPPERITVVPNGVDLSAFPRPDARPRRRLVTTVANLREGKGHEVLLRAAAIVLRTYPDARFRLVGDGPLAPRLVDLARSLGIGGSVDFLGHRQDVPALLAESDAFVLPSWTEAFPNSLIEAMAAGLPAVATEVGGVVELIADRHTGLLVPPGNEQAMARAIGELLDGLPLADAIGRAARESIEARYSFDRMVGRFEELYALELAARRSHPARGHELLVR